MKRITEFAALALIALLMLTSVLVNAAPHLGMLIGEIGSGSMIPTFDVGTMVVAVKVDPAQLQLNDIVVYQLSPEAQNYVSHRVVAISHNSPLTFTTQGDNNPLPDSSPVPAANIVGKIVFYAPGLGYFVQFLKTTLGLALCLILPALILIWVCARLILHEFIQLMKEKVAKDNKL
jgi:signal peptidase